MKAGVSLVRQTGRTLTTIPEQVSKINRHIGPVDEGAREQATALREISRIGSRLHEFVTTATRAGHGYGAGRTSLAA